MGALCEAIGGQGESDPACLDGATAEVVAETCQRLDRKDIVRNACARITESLICIILGLLGSIKIAFRLIGSIFRVNGSVFLLTARLSTRTIFINTVLHVF